MSYSVDLRERVVKFIEEGGSKSSAAILFCIDRSTILGWLKK
ncbi:MAG: IS630 transposase-related protein [Candidatus Paracaedibacteraceae bacterium]|nr:IS630 transposase-related protein [Candidatus Paracaedibacteraceae bacterium]